MMTVPHYAAVGPSETDEYIKDKRKGEPEPAKSKECCESKC